MFQLFLGFLLLLAYFWYLGAFAEHKREMGQFVDFNDERDYWRKKGTWTARDEQDYQEAAYTEAPVIIKTDHYYRVARKP